jgi:hypothetical protein
MTEPLFTFSYHRNARLPKARGVLRQANAILDRAKVRSVQFAPDDWFSFSHEHLDWNGIGDLGSKIRRRTIEAHCHLFRTYALAASKWSHPFQLWLSLGRKDAAQDAVYLHSPNPDTAFPESFDDVEWGISELELLVSAVLPEFEVVAGRRSWNYVVFAERVGVSLRAARG